MRKYSLIKKQSTSCIETDKIKEQVKYQRPVIPGHFLAANASIAMLEDRGCIISRVQRSEILTSINHDKDAYSESYNDFLHESPFVPIGFNLSLDAEWKYGCVEILEYFQTETWCT